MNFTSPARRLVDRFFYVLFAPVLKSGRKKRKETLRDLEAQYVAICNRLTKRELDKALEAAKKILRGVETVTPRALNRLTDAIIGSIQPPSEEDVKELGDIRRRAYDMGKNGVKRSIRATVKKAVISASTNLVDVRADAWARRDDMYWIGEHFDKRISGAMRDKISEFIQSGTGRAEAGKQLEALFGETYERNKSYWTGLAATAINRSRCFGAVAGYEEAGVESYEIVAMMDERTSPICRFMNGKVFYVKDAAKVRDAIINAKNPADVKTSHPWLPFKTAQNMSNEELAAAGFVVPPFHFHCRTTMVVRSFKPLFLSDEAKAQEPENMRTLAECEDYAHNVIGIKNVDYKGVDVQVAREWNEGLEDNIRRFPEVGKNINFVGETHQRNDLLKQLHYEVLCESAYKMLIEKGVPAKEALKAAHAYALDETKRLAAKLRVSKRQYADSFFMSVPGLEGATGITINRDHGQNYAAMKATVMKDVAEKWHPVGCGTIRALLDHEFAHQLDELLALSKDKEILSIMSGLRAADIADQLSGYAAENVKEFIAEAWAEYCNNKVPRPISKRVGERIEALYRKKFPK